MPHAVRLRDIIVDMKCKLFLWRLLGLASLLLVTLCVGCRKEPIKRDWSPRDWSSGTSMKAEPFAVQIYHNPSSLKGVSNVLLRVKVSRAGKPVSNATVRAHMWGLDPQEINLTSTGGNTYEGVVDFSDPTSYWYGMIFVSANGERGSTYCFRFKVY